MPSNLPASTQKLRPADMDLSIVQDNLANPVDKLLAFVNGLLNGSTAEALKIASLTATDAIKAATLAATGAVTGASAVFTGAVTGASVVSSAGFKSVIGPWLFEKDSSAIGAGSTFTLGWSYGAGTFAANISSSIVMPFAGSVLGLGARVELNGGASVVTMNINKNGSLLDNSVTASLPNSAGSGATSLSGIFAKGLRPFVPGDRLNVSMTITSAISAAIFMNAVLIVEMAA